MREWLHGLSKDDRKAIGTDIATVEYGWPLGNRIARTIFTINSGDMILLHGFIKKSGEDAKNRTGFGAISKEATEMNNKTNIGATLENFLEQEGLRDEVYAEAAKRIVALQLREAMKKTGTTVSEMARRMSTSRSQVERIIGLEAESVTVNSLAKAAHVVGYRLDMRLIKPNAKTRSKRVRVQTRHSLSAKDRRQGERRAKYA